MAYLPDPLTEHRPCDHPHCKGQGLYRAPKSTANLYDYHWFCLDHVRAYNKAWNYCSGMDEADIELEIRRSTTWERPTWSPTVPYYAEARLRQAIYENGGFYGFAAAIPPKPLKVTAESKALQVMGLSEPITLYEIKVQYRKLVKRHHPDANGGDPASEERLKKINQAFHTLKRAYETTYTNGTK